MTVRLREITREAADALLVGDRPGDVRVADDYPTEFSVGVAQVVGAEGQFGPYAVVESQMNRGYATAAIEALVTRARAASEVRRVVAHAPLERPQSSRVLEKAGFAMVREMDDADGAGNVLRVTEWELLT